MNKLIIIAAIGKNMELGYKNNLIWKIKDDMNHFKETTINHHVLMGENTYFSLKEPLKDRINMVLSNSEYKFPSNVIVFNSINEFFEKRKEIKDDIYIIGGANVYKEFIDIADELILTEIECCTNLCDSYFPNFNKNDYNKVILKEFLDYNPKFKFIRYIKK